MSSFLSLLFSILGLILMSGFMLIILVWSNDIWQFALLPICGTFCQIYCGRGGLVGQGGELVPPAYARPQNLCFSQPIPPSATLLCSVRSFLILHCLLLGTLDFNCYPASTLLCQAALHFQVHRARILMELFDQRESLPVVGGRHVALGAAPHMTTFARLSPVSNSHPFDFLTPPPHTMSKQHMHEI